MGDRLPEAVPREGPRPRLEAEGARSSALPSEEECPAVAARVHCDPHRYLFVTPRGDRLSAYFFFSDFSDTGASPDAASAA